MGCIEKSVSSGLWLNKGLEKRLDAEAVLCYDQF